MIIGNRFHRVRGLGAHGYTPPFVLARRRAQWPAELTPYASDEWVRLPGGRLVPMIRGGAFSQFQTPPPIWFGHGIASATQSTIALSSNYVYVTSGNAIAGRWSMPLAKTLASVYAFITAYTGTAANVNDLDLEVRDHSTNKPGATLVTSATLDPASATGWVAFTGLSAALSQDTIYWAVVGDADGGAVDFATVLRNITALNNPGGGIHGGAFSTADGFTTAATAASAQSSVVLAFSDGTAVGYPYTSIAASTSSTNRRGYVLGGLTASLKIWGMLSTTAVNATSVEVYDSGTVPGGSTLASGSVDIISFAAAPAVQGFALSAAYALAAATTYRVVYTYGSAQTTPNRYAIGTGADATLRSLMLGGGNWYWAEANGTTDWSNDNTALFPQSMLLVDDLVAASGGGGGSTNRIIGG